MNAPITVTFRNLEGTQVRTINAPIVENWQDELGKWATALACSEHSRLVSLTPSVEYECAAADLKEARARKARRQERMMSVTGIFIMLMAVVATVACVSLSFIVACSAIDGVISTFAAVMIIIACFGAMFPAWQLFGDYCL